MTSLKNLSVTEDGFVFAPSTGDTYTLNPCARLILQRLQQGETLPQIVQFLCTEFGLSCGVAERDMADFIQQLQTLGLVGI